MHIEIEPELESVLQFMESKISADKLLSVADALPGAARLLWKHSAMEQEPMAMARLSKSLFLLQMDRVGNKSPLNFSLCTFPTCIIVLRAVFGWGQGISFSGYGFKTTGIASIDSGMRRLDPGAVRFLERSTCFRSYLGELGKIEIDRHVVSFAGEAH